MGKRYRKQLSITMDDHLVKRVDRIAKKTDGTRSGVIESLVRDGIADAETQAKFLGDPVVMQAFSQAMSAPGVLSAMAAAMGSEISPDQQLQLRELLEGLGKIERGKA